jgi:hypothetical protein
MSGSRVIGAARAVPANVALVITAVLAFASAGLFGGLAPATTTTPTVASGTTLEAGPWRVTVMRARLFGDLPTLTLQEPGNRWLLVLATVEVTADESRNDMRDILRPREVPGLLTEAPSQMYLARDGTVVGHLNPGMPERVGFFWEQSADTIAPVEIDVWVQEKTHRVNSLTGHREWLDLRPRAQVHLPVDDQR